MPPNFDAGDHTSGEASPKTHTAGTGIDGQHEISTSDKAWTRIRSGRRFRNGKGI